MDAVRADNRLSSPQLELRGNLLVKPVVFGVVGWLGLLAFYLGVITLAQDWTHALQQLAEDRWFISAIALGFGAQIALFTHLRGLHDTASAGAMAASTGTSTTAMLACCAHHLTDLLPILGVAGVTGFLDAFKTPLLWLGISMNIVGVAYLVRKIRDAQRMACYHPGVGGE